MMRPNLSRSLFLLCLVLATTLETASAQDSYVVTHGDVTIVHMTGVNYPNKGQCGAYNVDRIQEILALTWFVDAVNDVNYVDGVTIGLEAYRLCGMSEKASQAAVHLMDKCGKTNSTPLLGIVGPLRTSDAMAVSSVISSLPLSERVLQISGGATGNQLSDKARFPNFFRVIPPDNIQIEVMLKLMLAMQWNYVAIVYVDNDYGSSAATQLRDLALENDICVPVFIGLPQDIASEDFATAIQNVVQQIKNSADGLVRGMVIIAGAHITSQLLNMLDDQAAFVELIMSEAVRLSTASSFNQGVAKGALFTSPPDIPVPEFSSFWNALWTNETLFNSTALRIPWLAGFLDEIVAPCSRQPPAAATCWEQSQATREAQLIPAGASGARTNLFLGYTLKAAAVVVEVLRRLHEEKCGGEGACAELMRSITGGTDVFGVMRPTAASSTLPSSGSSFSFSRFANVSKTLAETPVISFDANGESVEEPSGGSRYGVFNMETSGKYIQVGTFAAGRLSLNESAITFYRDDGTPAAWAQMEPAQCDVNHNCRNCERDVSNSVVVVPGDFYILAIVPVHKKHPTDLLKCGDLKDLSGADMAEAVIFAVQEANKKRGQFRNILPGRSVGVIIINSCGSKLLVRRRLMDFFSGRLVLPDGNSSLTVVDKTVMVLGGFYSSSSIAASDTITPLERPFVQVSPASTSPDLKDRTKHPYFMRLVPSDEKQAQVMLGIVKRLNANYIQVIYDSSTAYATGLFREMEAALASNAAYNVCIAQSIATKPRKDVSEYTYIVDKLRDKSFARIVVIILHSEEIKKMMDAILPKLGPAHDFLFLASESWGRRQAIIDGRTSLRGTLVLSQELVKDQLFADYFAELDPSAPASAARNPWLRLFWETRVHCYFPNSFERKDRRPCPSENLAEVYYSQDTRIPYYIQSVYALVKGFHQALTQHCGSAALSVCPALSSEQLVSAMKSVKLDLFGTGQEAPVFDQNGDGPMIFKVLRVDLEESGSDVKYTEVGQWKNGGLILQKSDVKEVVSNCPNSAECKACFPDPQNPGPGPGGGTDAQGGAAESSGVPVAVTAGVASGLGLLIIALVVVIVFLVRRQKQLRDTNLRSERRRQHAEAVIGWENNRYICDTDQYSMPNILPWTPSEGMPMRQPLPLPTPCQKQSASNYLTPCEETSPPS